MTAEREEETKERIVGMIWVQTLDGVIGNHGDLPWYLPEDLKHFKDTTINHPVIMGRITWDSIPEKNRPLPNRTNIVITRNEDLIAELNEIPNVIAVNEVAEALKVASDAEGAEEVWVIGGASIFDLTVESANVAEITFIRSEDYEGDTFAPNLGDEWSVSNSKPNGSRDADSGWYTSKEGLQYRIERWEK